MFFGRQRVPTCQSPLHMVQIGKIQDVSIHQMTDENYLVDMDKKLIFIQGSVTPYDNNCPMAVIHKKQHKSLFLTNTTTKFKHMNKEDIDI